MTQISIAFMIVALITGISLFSLAFDTMMYSVPPQGRWRWLTGLLAVTIILSFMSVITNSKSCSDYTTGDYRYGRTPISCPMPKDLKDSRDV